ncbi:MAG TPA: hypothetical protein PLZ36_15350, partial [Armatimonadota bacterium]|nr:hypothetical protein [Armatimonadota bacterium]
MVNTQEAVPVEHPAAPPPSRREVWQLPWGWPEAFLLQGGILFVAFCVEFVLHRRGISPVIPVPMNWILPGAFVLGAMAVSAIGRGDRVIRWLSGVQFAVAGITLYTLLGLAGILIAQGHTHDPLSEWGLRDLFTSLPFLAASLLIMLNLVMVIGRRFAAPRPGFIGFMLNHLGLLLVMGGMIAGSAQLRKPSFALFTNQTISSISDDERKLTHRLGGSVTLDRFNIDYYPAKTSLFAIDMPAMMHGKADFHVADQALVTKGHVFTAYGMTVTVQEYLPSAFLTEDGAWRESPHHGLAAAKVAYATAGGVTGMGWVAEGMEHIL